MMRFAINNKMFLALLVGGATLLGVVSISSVLAKGESLKGLTISPLKTELNIAPGTSVEGVLTVANLTDASIEVNFGAEEFDVINEQYDYSFNPESDVSKWAVFKEKSLKLAKDEKKTIKYSVSAPINSEPGGRYISLFASTSTQLDNGEVKSIQRVSSLLYVTVNGDVTRVGKLLSLNSPKILKRNSLFAFSLQNKGTAHFTSRYSVTIKNLFNNDNVASLSGNSLILPGTIRSVSDKMPLSKSPGLYKVIYQIGLGDTPAVIEKHYVLYLPPAFIVFVVAVGSFVGLMTRRKKESRL